MMPFCAAMANREVEERRNVGEKRGIENDVEGPSQDTKHARLAEVYRLDQLPLEVLEKIFARLRLCDRINVRLVNRSLYEACSRNEKIRITKDDERDYFRHCGLGNVGVTLACTRVEWNSEIWQDFGSRIQMLNLHDCLLGDRMMTGVIRFCDNLRILRVTLKNLNTEFSFCSPETLERLEIVRKKLETLEICRKRIRPPSDPISVDHDHWKRIFAALLGIYPNLQHYTGGQQDDDVDYFTCSFSTQPKHADQSEVSASLALLLSAYDEDWSSALKVFSVSRFAAFSYVQSRFLTDSLQTGLIEFFRSQKALVSVKFKQGQGRGWRVTDSHERELTKSVVLEIARHCSCIRELEFIESKSLGDMYLTFHHLSLTECSDLFSNLSNMDQVTFGTAIERSSASLSLALRRFWRSAINESLDRFLIDFISYHVMIEHLFLTNSVSDEVLRTVFRYMTRLKTLQMHLRKHNTCSALTGRQEGHPGCFSIKRLHQLEKLTIHSERFRYDDSMFDAFDFPNLRSFHCFPPKNLSTLPSLMTRMPVLREVAFSSPQIIPLEIICRITVELDTIHFVDVLRLLSDHDVKEIFESHPSLRTLGTKNRIHFKQLTNGHVRYFSKKTFAETSFVFSCVPSHFESS